ncbi:putative toxin-antitoxin system toxin component, PIN family [Spiribacter vilamensis]|uniref:Putative PIN family toxin of toxin-antitoxin system n=1 Tax=Spiribacter vilamensis TaxID=531306 RepID=A0A4Q8D164_9GAMM|nr:putative toxin-antitoxin system toxin component, PIN family [Spiribacter vilamensis]RZU99089.1 putative PIN family toxin of toxin-antitoxin system [Spiribacter vilamensis]
MTTPRVVLDTNCLVSALLFSNRRTDWLRTGWQARRFIPLASHATAAELLRVLAYPKFQLSADEQEALLADYLPWVETITVTTAGRALPAIDDPDDRMFLLLADVADANALVSGDKHLQAVKGEFSIPIVSASEFADWLT